MRRSHRRAAAGVFGLILLAAAVACSGKRSEALPPDLALFEAGRLQFPGASWAEVKDLNRWGWSAERLENAQAYFETPGSSTGMIVHRGVLIAGWGDLDDRQPSQSIRKALLGALLGQEVTPAA